MDPLLHKLDAFTRKYYKNQLLRGAAYFVIATLLAFLTVAALEFFGRYNSTVRAVLFYSFLSFSVYCLLRFVIIPLAHMYRIGTTISHRQAAQIIGQHFPEVKDKLLNTLQLRHDAEKQADASLLMAAIGQKTEQLKPVPFVAAIDLRNNLRYARYVLLPVLLYAVIYMVAPGMISDSGKRVLRYSETFKPQAPFQFLIENKTLKAEQFADFTLNLKLAGNELPDAVFVEREGNSYKMQKLDNTHFSYTFTSLRKSEPFVLKADAYSSDNYEIEVVSKPQLLSYQVHIGYPAYLGKRDETLNSPGDLTVPAGSTLRWKFVSRQTDEILLGFNGPAVKAETSERDLFTYTKKLFLSTAYFIKTLNAKTRNGDSLQYSINVIPDAFPTLSVEEKTDSIRGRDVYFIGDAADDYGLTRLQFHYRFVKSETPEKTKLGLRTRQLAIDKGSLSQRFYHQVSMDELGVAPSDDVEYYFEVWDNDGVHGPKATRSKTMLFRSPSEKELEKKSESGSSALKDKMEEAIKETASLQREMKDLDRKMLDKKELTWEEKKKLESILERQKKLAEKIDQIKNEQKQLSQQEQEYKKQSEEIMQKQQQIEKMFNEIMNDEMKKLIKQVEDMLQQQNKDKVKQEMDKMELSNKDVQKELDRMLEQFKKLELEKKREDAVNKLDKLSEKQDELSKKSEQLANNKNLDKEAKKEQLDALKKEQDKAKEEFKDLKEQLKDIEEKNKALEEPEEIEDTQEDQKEIDQKMDESKDEMNKSDAKKASQKQKQAADKMKQMSDRMKKSMDAGEQKELELNAEALREILENAIQLSKDQEALMESFKDVNGYNPQYVDMAKEQKRIKDNAKIVEDSLLALSKKVPQISSFVNREVSRLNDNLDRSIKGFGLRSFGEIRTRQQYAMTSANNLAVMLSDILKQMQQDMNAKGKGKGQGKNKAKGKGEGKGQGKSMGSLKKMQEELNRQLREGLNKQEGKGNKDGKGEKPGEKGGSGGEGGMSSQEYARMAAQQMAIRQQMQKMMQEMDAKEREGMGGTKALQDMQRLMEQTEKELFNKRLSSEMIMRQQDIMTRMLESEKAERKQEQDKKREAEQAKDKPAPTPPGFEQYIRQKNREKELQQTIPAELQPYYREKAKEYFNKVGTE